MKEMILIDITCTNLEGIVRSNYCRKVMKKRNTESDIDEEMKSQDLINVEQSHDNLVEAFKDQVPSKRTVERLYLDFRRERTSLQDEARSGRLSTAVTPETITAAETLSERIAALTMSSLLRP
ncbi:Histone-lysine N-methyltransferase SETMAR [Oopsacas minuta]|uniref:Histone-lysine N-methyltransferase SETMAR n=1 Tax=Oopsacas minuta TaxID=111878 RepID=A0AAV7K053_9METZ|nr:Histone-lysine N-methyltransferase SETMAR [Oopsacas minuta]